jgi:hypothetical protein
VAILPIGATEAHGRTCRSAPTPSSRSRWRAPGAERFAGKGCRRAAAALLVQRGAVRGGIPGTCRCPRSTVRELVLDVARELTAPQFMALAIANAHLIPRTSAR